MSEPFLTPLSQISFAELQVASFVSSCTVSSKRVPRRLTELPVRASSRKTRSWLARQQGARYNDRQDRPTTTGTTQRRLTHEIPRGRDGLSSGQPAVANAVLERSSDGALAHWFVAGHACIA